MDGMSIYWLNESTKEATANVAFRKETERLDNLRAITITITPSSSSSPSSSPSLDLGTPTLAFTANEEATIGSVVTYALEPLPEIWKGEYEFWTISTSGKMWYQLRRNSGAMVGSLVPRPEMGLEVRVLC